MANVRNLLSCYLILALGASNVVADDQTTHHGKITKPAENAQLTTDVNYAAEGKLWSELRHDPPEPEDPVVSPRVGINVVIEVWHWDPILNKAIGQNPMTSFAGGPTDVLGNFSLNLNISPNAIPEQNFSGWGLLVLRAANDPKEFDHVVVEILVVNNPPQPPPNPDS